ncbi:hypothetical protein AMTRI_Chr01g103740 [Amborella trichopoda]
MEGTLFHYKMFSKNCISHIISIKYIMNSITRNFQLSRHQIGEITSTTVYQTGFQAFTLPIFTCIPESRRKVNSRGDSQGDCSESYQTLPSFLPLSPIICTLSVHSPSLPLFPTFCTHTHSLSLSHKHIEVFFVEALNPPLAWSVYFFLIFLREPFSVRKPSIYFSVNHNKKHVQFTIYRWKKNLEISVFFSCLQHKKRGFFGDLL